MIGRITGRLLEKNPPQILIEAQGIGYELEVPMSTFCNLPASGEEVSLHTHFVVREDAQLLYGFLTLDERAAFRQLIRIGGIGARIALAVLSGLSAAELAQAVAMQETGRLIKIPGIGRKTAERLLLELKDKLPAGGVAKVSSAGTVLPATDDILAALAALGYSEREALAAINGLPAGLSVSEGIRQALQRLARA